MAMPRRPEEWVTILDGMTAQSAAKRITEDMAHYLPGRAWEDEDMAQLAAALEAWSRLKAQLRTKP